MQHLTSPTFRKTLLTMAMSVPFFLSACGTDKPKNKNVEHEGHEHGEHEGHEHGEHEGHEHGEHEGHEHGEHEGHEHGEHEGHEHGEHEGHEHGEHEGHEHGEHEGHEHGEHEGHEHGEHDHHGHSHGSGAKQVIPEGYTVNFAVSNHPLLLLSEAVTTGTKTTVKKLLGAGDVGHHGSLSPSDIKAVGDSKYVVWFGKALESNLSNTLTKAPNTITILDEKGVTVLDHRNEKAEVITGSPDPHIWLDPNNAKAIVNKLAELHSDTNPELASTYQKNAKKFANDLDILVAEHQAKRTKTKKYWSSHDAFQYLEKSMNIKLAGALTTDHEIPAKASQILWLKNNRPNETMCLLAQGEPKDGIKNQLKPVVSKVLVEDMSDSETYLQAWENSAKTVESCLGE